MEHRSWRRRFSHHLLSTEAEATYLAKLTPTGHILWRKRFGVETQTDSDMAVDSAGNSHEQSASSPQLQSAPGGQMISEAVLYGQSTQVEPASQTSLQSPEHFASHDAPSEHVMRQPVPQLTSHFETSLQSSAQKPSGQSVEQYSVASGRQTHVHESARAAGAPRHVNEPLWEQQVDSCFGVFERRADVRHVAFRIDHDVQGVDVVGHSVCAEELAVEVEGDGEVQVEPLLVVGGGLSGIEAVKGDRGELGAVVLGNEVAGYQR